MLHGVPSLRVDRAQTMGALQSRQTPSNGLRLVSSGTRRRLPHYGNSFRETSSRYTVPRKSPMKKQSPASPLVTGMVKSTV